MKNAHIGITDLGERLPCGCEARFDRIKKTVYIDYCSDAHGRRLFMGWNDIVLMDAGSWHIWRLWLEAANEDDEA